MIRSLRTTGITNIAWWSGGELGLAFYTLSTVSTEGAEVIGGISSFYSGLCQVWSRKKHFDYKQSSIFRFRDAGKTS